MPERAAMTWTELVETCSRLHTTRERRVGPWPDAGMREDSQMVDVLIDGVKAQVIPTRMHEPGFYWRWMEFDQVGIPQRSEKALLELRQYVDEGRVDPL